MIKQSLAGVAVAVGGVALSLVAGSGVAAAEPDWGPMINTTCTYDQAMAAVHAENPAAAQYLDSSPPNLEFIRVFLASSPEKRMSLINAVKNNPGADQALPVIQQTLASCNNY